MLHPIESKVIFSCVFCEQSADPLKDSGRTNYDARDLLSYDECYSCVVPLRKLMLPPIWSVREDTVSRLDVTEHHSKHAEAGSASNEMKSSKQWWHLHSRYGQSECITMLVLLH